MEHFIYRENVKRYPRLLDGTVDEFKTTPDFEIGR